MERLDSVDDWVVCSLCEIIKESVAEKFTQAFVIMILRVDFECHVRQNGKIESPSCEGN
ncbi:hypothetical protein [Haloarcula marismortui]|uniref:hypothetical protein n=1 Tax=Haloarcula marismortui TaxID=2238 RepID=UPI001E60C28B|nr:hypothetical protein [Haloarcula sinaiiensis]